MATAVRRFLVQLMRHDEQGYGQIREGVRQRYEATPHAIFGWKKLDDDGVNEPRQSVAEDLAYLVETFRQVTLTFPGVGAAYQMMVKVFEQQCEVVGERVAVRKHPGGEIVCKRSGIESTNSLLKRVTGLGRLRVRGRQSVFMSIYLKVAGWNVVRATAVRSVIEKLTKPGQAASTTQCSGILNLLMAFRSFAVAA